MRVNAKQVALVAADIISFYLALTLALLLRSGLSFSFMLLRDHLGPFTAVAAIWLVVFWLAGLYDFRQVVVRMRHLRALLTAIIVALAVSVLLFYVVPSFRLTPKTILALLGFSFLVIGFPLREAIARHLVTLIPPRRVFVIGRGREVRELVDYLRAHLELGYQVMAWLERPTVAAITEAIAAHQPDLLVVPARVGRGKALSGEIFHELLRGAEVVTFATFYEQVFSKVSLEALGEDWFLEELEPKQGFYLFLKRILDLIVALIVLLITLPFWPLMALAVVTSSAGPVFKLLPRAGYREQNFTPYKFRTMHLAGDVPTKIGEHFGTQPDDTRVFPVGRWLRRLRLDELPQVLNVLRGELSFVGPRADFIDFYRHLKAKIPYYQVRTIVPPGLTGWAQIHDRYGSSLEGTRERLAYDIYYIKHRSLVLDLVILLKTIRTVCTFSGI